MLRVTRQFGILASLLLAACTTVTQSDEKTAVQPLVWPQPPDQPRFIY